MKGDIRHVELVRTTRDATLVPTVDFRRHECERLQLCLRGFCLLHPKDEEKGFILMKCLPPSQNNEEVTYRVSSEFSLHVAADFNIVRIKGIGMPFRPRLTTFRTAFDGV